MTENIEIKPADPKFTERLFPTILFVLVTVLVVWDIAIDLVAGTTATHLAIEFIIMLAAITGAFWSLGQFRTARRLEKDLQQNPEKASEETSNWKGNEQSVLDEFRVVIDKQLTEWNYSAKEKEMAFYLLKGLSLKEIAELKGGTYISVKQQAHLLYRKAGLGGRTELSAFFLDRIV